MFADDEFEVRMRPGGPAFMAPRDSTLLQAAARAGFEWPSSCRNGTCRACMRRLASGVVHYRIEWPGLLAEEKAEGWILPCVAEPRSRLVFADDQ
jgi:ferredoxin